MRSGQILFEKAPSRTLENSPGRVQETPLKKKEGDMIPIKKKKKLETSSPQKRGGGKKKKKKKKKKKPNTAD